MYYRVKTEAGRRMKASWGRAGYVTGMVKLAKRHDRSPERLLRKILGCCAVTEVDRKTHNDYYTHTFGVSLVKSLGIHDKAEINTGLQGDQWSPLQDDSKTNTVFRRKMAPARGTFSPCPISGRMALAGYPPAAHSWFCPQSYCDGERGSALRRMLPRAPAFTSAGEKWKLTLMDDC